MMIRPYGTNLDPAQLFATLDLRRYHYFIAINAQFPLNRVSASFTTSVVHRFK